MLNQRPLPTLIQPPLARIALQHTEPVLKDLQPIRDLAKLRLVRLYFGQQLRRAANIHLCGHTTTGPKLANADAVSSDYTAPNDRAMATQHIYIFAGFHHAAHYSISCSGDTHRRKLRPV